MCALPYYKPSYIQLSTVKVPNFLITQTTVRLLKKRHLLCNSSCPWEYSSSAVWSSSGEHLPRTVRGVALAFVTMSPKWGWCIHRGNAEQLPQIISLSIPIISWLIIGVLILLLERVPWKIQFIKLFAFLFFYESRKYLSCSFTHQVMFRKPIHNFYQHIWQTIKKMTANMWWELQQKAQKMW